LVVLGVASNSFNQEDKQEAAAAKICFVNFGVTFTMLAPVPVKGPNAHPFFAGLNKQSSAPTWNFNKYLVDPSGHVVAKFGSTTSPTSNKLVKAISGVLAQ
jgi:glutathione peroxidase